MTVPLLSLAYPQFIPPLKFLFPSFSFLSASFFLSFFLFPAPIRPRWWRWKTVGQVELAARKSPTMGLIEKLALLFDSRSVVENIKMVKRMFWHETWAFGLGTWTASSTGDLFWREMFDQVTRFNELPNSKRYSPRYKANQRRTRSWLGKRHNTAVVSWYVVVRRGDFGSTG